MPYGFRSSRLCSSTTDIINVDPSREGSGTYTTSEQFWRWEGSDGSSVFSDWQNQSKPWPMDYTRYHRKQWAITAILTPPEGINVPRHRRSSPAFWIGPLDRRTVCWSNEHITAIFTLAEGATPNTKQIRSTIARVAMIEWRALPLTHRPVDLNCHISYYTCAKGGPRQCITIPSKGIKSSTDVPAAVLRVC